MLLAKGEPLTPRASAGIIARKYIQLEENVSQHGAVEEEERGMGNTRKVCTQIARKFEISDTSKNEDDVMTEVELRGKAPYIMRTKKGIKRNMGKRVERSKTPA